MLTILHNKPEKTSEEFRSTKFKESQKSNKELKEPNEKN